LPQPIPAPRESGYTITTPVPLYWAAYGHAGAPRVLVLHGGPGAHHDYLLPQMLRVADLAGGRELFFYDQRGGGRSRTDDRTPITWRTHVEDMALVTRELGLGAPPVLGYSWGGLLAMLYAIEASDRAGEGAPAALPLPSSLALVDPAPLTRPLRQRFEAEFARRSQSAEIQAMRDELARSGLRERDPEQYRQRAFELSVAGYFHDPRAVHDLTPFRVVGRVQQSVWESLGDFDLTAALARVRLPALVVHGREDPIPLASSEAAATALGAELVVLERCGHVPYVEQPGPLFDALERFLADAGG
jgi:proline iminopeptidase